MIFEIVLAAASVASKIGQGIAQTRAARAARREGRLLAADAIDRGEEDVRRYEMGFAQFIGSQRASIGAQMVDLEYGTAKDLRENATKYALEDVATIRLNAQKEARGYRSQYGAVANQQSVAAAFSFLDAGVDAFTYWNRSRRVNVTGPMRPSDSPQLAGQARARGSTYVAPPRPVRALLPPAGGTSSSRLTR
jgi:hypothetical protein